MRVNNKQLMLITCIISTDDHGYIAITILLSPT